MTEVIKKEFQKYLTIYFSTKRECHCTNIENVCDKCFKHLKKVKHYIECGIPLRYFDLDLEVLKDIKNIATKQQYILKTQLYNNVKNYIENMDLNFAQGKGMLICGDMGVGKTTALMNIAKAACDKNKNIKVVYMSELINDIFSGNSIIDEISDYDALFLENIEHVYVKKDSNYVDTVIDSLFSLSIKYNISLFITTNLSVSQLKDKFTPHAFSLLHEICDIYSLEGIDVRKKSIL